MSELPPSDGGGSASDDHRPWGLPGAAVDSGPSVASAPAAGASSGWGPAAFTAGSFGAPAGQWRPPPKPGVVPLRPLGLGELLDGSVQTMRQNPRVMLGLSAAVMAVAGALSTIFMVTGLPQVLSAIDTPEGPVGAAQIAGVIGGGISGFVVPAVIQGFAVVVLSGVLILAVSEAVLGRRPTVSQVWGQARRRILPLLGLSLLTGALSVLGFALLVGPGIALLAVSGRAAAVALVIGVPLAIVLSALLYVRFAFAAPALLLENLGIVAALRRSWHLVRGSWWRVLGILLLTAVIASVANGLLQTPFSILGAVIAAAVVPSDAAGAAAVTPTLLITSVVGNIGTVLASTVSAPFSAAVTALLYIDLRIRREGLDVALARAAAET